LHKNAWFLNQIFQKILGEGTAPSPDSVPPPQLPLPYSKLLDPPLSTAIPSLQTLDFPLPQHSFHDTTCADHPPPLYVQWPISLYLVGAACAQWEIGGITFFIRLWIKTPPPIFHWENYTLRKLPLIFYLSPIFSICVFNKTFPLFNTSPIFHWAIYTLNKTFFLEREEAHKGHENLSQKLGGTSAQNWGRGKLRQISISDFGGYKPLLIFIRPWKSARLRQWNSDSGVARIPRNVNWGLTSLPFLFPLLPLPSLLRSKITKFQSSLGQALLVGSGAKIEFRVI